MINAYKMLVGNVKDLGKDIRVDGRTILKQVLSKKRMRSSELDSTGILYVKTVINYRVL
jgi:hypothetical protein